MDFNYVDYQRLLRTRQLEFPKNFFSYLNIDKLLLYKYKNQNNGSLFDIGNSYNQLENRVSEDYYRRILKAQGKILSYSYEVFPAYRFILPEVLRNDWVATVDWSKYTRDHALHQPLTSYVVSKLLGGGDSMQSLTVGNTNLLDICIDSILEWRGTEYLKEYLLNLGVTNDSIFENNNRNRIFWKKLFFEVSFVAACFHDLGYPWQRTQMLSHNLEHIRINSIDSNYEFIESSKERLLFYPLNGYKKINNGVPCNWSKKYKDIIETVSKNTHGFPGAMGFIYLYDIIRKYPEERPLPFHQFCVDWAAMGIMMHDLCKTYWGCGKMPLNSQLRLKIDVDPLSFVLTLADQLEDFARPSSKFTKTNDNITVEYPYYCNSTAIEVVNNIIYISFLMNDDNERVRRRSFFQDEYRKYYNPNFGFLDISGLDAIDVVLFAS